MSKFGWITQPEVMDLKLGNKIKNFKRIDSSKMLRCGGEFGSPPMKISLLHHLKDLRFNQKDPSCVANSLVNAIIIVHSILYPNKPITVPSIMALYYWSRETHGAESINMGTFIFACIEAAKELGIPLAGTWPENKSAYDKPEWSVYTDANPNKELKTERIYDMDDDFIKRIKQVVGLEQRPIQFGMDVDDKFVNWTDKSSSDIYEYVGPSIGGHGMTVVGYDDLKQDVEVINSLGRDFGYNGAFRVGYNTVVKYFRESTVIKSVPLLTA